MELQSRKNNLDIHEQFLFKYGMSVQNDIPFNKPNKPLMLTL